MAVAVVAAVGVALASGGAVHATPSVSSLTAQIKTASQQFEKVVEQYDKVNGEKAKTKKQIAALDKKIKPLTASVNAQRARVAEIAAQAYKGGTATAWNAVLGSGDLVGGVSTLDAISARQTAQINDLTTAQKNLSTQRAKLDKLYATLAKQSKDLAAKKKAIEAKIVKLKAMREQAYGSATNTSTGTSSSSPSVAVSGSAGVAVKFAYAQLGKPYVWAAAGPDSYDCSGLTMAAWSQAGVSLPHNAAEQYNSITHISRSQIQPGDLVFYESLGHVAIYVGNNQVIHAPTYGEVVKVSSIDMMPVYGIGRP